MAINPLSYADLEGDDSTKNNARNNIGGGAGTGVSGGSQISEGASGTVSSSPGTAVGSASEKPTSSGSFTNLQSYLNANADQSQGLGGKIANNVQGEANQGASDLNSSVNSFKSDTDKADQGINANTLGDVQGTFNKAVSDPTSLQDSDYSTINNIYGANGTGGLGSQYQNGGTPGPKDLTGYDSYNTAVNELQNTANDAQNLGSESGRQVLLNQAFARPDYNQGQQQLDQLLLQGNQANTSKFQDLQNQLLGTGSAAQQMPVNVDYTTYAGPSTSLSGQEAAAQQAANTYGTQASTNVNNAYNLIQSYLNGNGGTTPLQISAPSNTSLDQSINQPQFPTGGNSSTNPNSVSGSTPVDISNGGLFGYAGTQAQQQVDTANAAQAAAYNNELNALNTQLAPAEQNIYQSYLNAINKRPATVNGQRQLAYNPQYTTADQLQQQFANTGANQATLSNAVDPNTVAMVAALNKLAGNPSLNTIGSGTGAQTVGSGYTAPTPFDQQAALAKQIAAYNQYVQSIPNYARDTR